MIEFTLQGHSPALREVRMELKAETREAQCVLASSLVHVELAFFLQPGTTCFGMVTPTMDGAFLHQLIIEIITDRHYNKPS